MRVEGPAGLGRGQPPVVRSADGGLVGDSSGLVGDSGHWQRKGGSAQSKVEGMPRVGREQRLPGGR